MKLDQTAMDQYIPGYMHQGLDNYVYHHIQPGSFLFHMLSANLERAVFHADSYNQFHMVSYIEYFEKYLDPELWGSREKVDAWIARRFE
jgi:hypothetical protein